MRIASLIPTYKRAHKLRDFIRNHDECSTESQLYFIISSDDPDTKLLLIQLNQKFFVSEGEYVECINYGWQATDEEFVVCAADDVVFTPGWDTTLLSMADRNPDKHIFGGIDEWTISMTMKHISHPMVRRNHFWVRDVDNNLYYPGYIHYLCDIEFIQRGMREGCVMITPQILIEHPHTVTQHLVQSEWDETYKRSFSKIDHDHDLYNRRKGEFEVWDLQELNNGYAIPTKLNPQYNHTFLSIVIPSYADYVNIQQTLQSVVNNTYYRFEIIIVNDGPQGEMLDPWTVVNREVFFDSIVLKDQSCDIRVVHSKKQMWVNHNWNVGFNMAKGNYVAFLNSDITLSRDWDKYLIAVLDIKGHKRTVACPFETNPHTKVPYSLDKHMMKYAPNMIKGQCFLMRRLDGEKIFPIPSELKHWCGDNYIADQAEKMDGVVFAKKAIVHHLISQSSKKVKSSKLQERTFKDILAYEKLSGKNMNWIKRTFPKVIQDFCLADVHESESPQKS